MKNFINVAALIIAFVFATFTSNYIFAPSASALDANSTVTLVVGDNTPDAPAGPEDPDDPPDVPPAGPTNPSNPTSPGLTTPNTGHQTSSSSASTWQGIIIITASIILITAAVAILVRHHRRGSKLNFSAFLPLIFSISTLTVLATLTLTACGQSAQNQAQAQPRYAPDEDPELNFSVGAPVQLSYSAELGGIYFGSQTVSVQTNNTDGYSLFINTVSDHGALTSATNDSVVAPVPTTAENPGDLTDNTWGFIPLQFAFGYPEYLFFAPVPAADSTGAATAIHITATPNELDDVTQVFFGAKITDDFPTGTYSTTIVYTVLANSEPPDTPI